MIPEGTYIGTITSAVLGVSKKNNPELVLQIAVQSEPPARRTIRWYFTEACEKYTQDKLKALGFNGDFDQPMFNDAAAVTGVEWNCTHEDYQGEMKERWELASWGGAAAEKAPADVIRKMTALWKSKNGASKPVTAPAPRTTPKAPPAAPATSPAPAAPVAPPAVTAPPAEISWPLARIRDMVEYVAATREHRVEDHSSRPHFRA